MAAKRIEDFRLIDAGWDTELDRALQHDRSTVKIVSPFIKRRALERLFAQGQPTSLKVITRFNLADFAGGVSDIGALRRMLEAGARLRGVRYLHAKLYLFGTSRVIVTSANLTEAALLRNHEFGFVATDKAIIKRCQKYFDDLWARAGQNLTAELLDNWEEQLSRHLATGGRPDKASGLGDEGANLGLGVERPTSEFWEGDAGQAFVKFLGQSSNRVPLSFTTLKEIKRAGCHWAVAYPASKRPRRVEDGALIFIGRLTRGPNDIRVFGRAIGMRHVPGRDDATRTLRDLLMTAAIALAPEGQEWIYQEEAARFQSERPHGT